MEWSKESTSRLIDEFRGKRCLWDPTCPDYRNRACKRYNLCEIGRLFNVSDKEIENKLHNVRSQFLREYKKSAKKRHSKAGNGYVSKWFAYDSLLFLKDANKQRCNIPPIEIPYEEPQMEPSSPHMIDLDEASTSNTEAASVPSPAPMCKIFRTTETLEPSSATVDDKHTVFAKYVETELREIHNRKRLEILKKKIQDVIFETKLEEIEESERTLAQGSVIPRQSDNALTIQVKDENIMCFFGENSP